MRDADRARRRRLAQVALPNRGIETAHLGYDPLTSPVGGSTAAALRQELFILFSAIRGDFGQGARALVRAGLEDFGRGARALGQGQAAAAEESCESTHLPSPNAIIFDWHAFRHLKYTCIEYGPSMSGAIDDQPTGL